MFETTQNEAHLLLFLPKQLKATHVSWKISLLLSLFKGDGGRGMCKRIGKSLVLSMSPLRLQLRKVDTTK